MKTYAIIPSGGSGSRSGTAVPKQYVNFNGKELIVYTLKIFQNCSEIDEIIIAAEEKYFDLIDKLKSKYDLTKIKKVVAGGKERQDSVFNALRVINAAPDDLIAVHDAARPLLPTETLNGAIKFAKENGSAVTAIKAKDTLIRSDNRLFDHVDRKNIFYAQTPQIFNYKVLMDSMNKAYEKNLIGTDESEIVRSAGYDVKLFEGSSLNFKITTNSDIKLFELLADRI